MLKTLRDAVAGMFEPGWPQKMSFWACVSEGKPLGYVHATTEQDALKQAAIRWPHLKDVITVYIWEGVL